MRGITRSAAIVPAVWLAFTASIASPSFSQPAGLPPEAAEWTRTDGVDEYVGKDLFLMIDGGADLFFEYGFERALASEYSRSPGARASVELYEMQHPAAAYGVYSSFAAGTETVEHIGQESAAGDGYCIFWKGTYVGIVTVAQGDPVPAAHLLQLSEALAAGIIHEAPLPRLCALLRKAGLDPRRMVYVRGKLGLGNHLHQAWADPFPPADGVVGTSGGSRYLILELRDSAAADAALRRAAGEWEKLQPPAELDSGGIWTVRPPDEGATRLERYGRHIIAVTGNGDASRTLESSLRRLLKDQ